MSVLAAQRDGLPGTVPAVVSCMDVEVGAVGLGHWFLPFLNGCCGFTCSWEQISMPGHLLGTLLCIWLQAWALPPLPKCSSKQVMFLSEFMVQQPLRHCAAKAVLARCQ